MRLLGLLIMACALTGMGFLLAERKKERLLLLLQLRQMIHYLKSQILYSNAPLPEAIFEVGDHFRNPEGLDWEMADFFMSVSNKLDEKEESTFSVIWETEAEKIPSHISLTGKDREQLCSLGKNLGYADRNMQERTLLFYLEQLDETKEIVKEEAEQLGKLYRTLGAAAGIFWFVLLI